MSLTIPQPNTNKNTFNSPSRELELRSAPLDGQRDGDTELERRVTTFLAQRHRPALRQIEVQAEQGIVTLHGKVETFHEKQLSAQIARRVAGVVQLVDEVIVGPFSRDLERKRNRVTRTTFSLQGDLRSRPSVNS